jgi:MFS family permease
MEKRVLSQNLLMCTLIAMLGATATSLSSLFARMAEAVGLPPSGVGVFVSVYMVGSGVSVFFAGPLADRLGKRRIVACGALLMALGLSGVAAPLARRPLLSGFLYWAWALARRSRWAARFSPTKTARAPPCG